MTSYQLFEKKEQALYYKKSNGGMLIDLNKKYPNRKSNTYRDFYRIFCGVTDPKWNYSVERNI